jgi:hypothetical protein
MSNMDLRPLSLGELLDRTFTLYRENFLLFIGISAIPHILVLALNLVPIALMPSKVTTSGLTAAHLQSHAQGISWGGGFVAILFGIALLITTLLAYLLSQGATVLAVSELYLGRTTTIGAAFRRVRGELGTIFGVLFLSGLATGAAFILLIVPGIYVACRLAVCVPAALLENIGPRDSLERSFALTKGNAGRAFLIYLLYFCLVYAALMLFTLPFTFALAAVRHDPTMVRIWTAGMQVGSFVGNVLVTPVLTIATALFYYDLRVRKEAFDIQMMMTNPLGTGTPATGGVPNLLT